jgi:hypothetical protein
LENRALGRVIESVETRPPWAHWFERAARFTTAACLFKEHAFTVENLPTVRSRSACFCEWVFQTNALKEGSVEMNSQERPYGRKALALVLLTPLLIAEIAIGQNLGSSPQMNVAVQGQTGAQPEGAFLNFINWIGNVISPVGAGGAVVGAVVAWLTGRGFGRWLFAAAALLAVSGLTRLIEFWVTNGTGGVT